VRGDDLPVVFLARGRLSICVGKGRVDGTGFVAAPVPHSLLARNQKMNVSSFTHAGRGNAIASSPLEPPQAITGGGRGVGTTAAAQRCRGQGVVRGGELNPMFGRRVRDATVIGNRAGASGEGRPAAAICPYPVALATADIASSIRNAEALVWALRQSMATSSCQNEVNCGRVLGRRSDGVAHRGNRRRHGTGKEDRHDR